MGNGNDFLTYDKNGVSGRKLGTTGQMVYMVVYMCY